MHDEVDDLRTLRQERRELLSALIAAVDDRARVLAAVSEAESVADASADVRSLLRISESAAQAVLSLQLLRFTKQQTQAMRDERDELIRSLDAS